MERRPFTITRMRVVDGEFEAYVTVNGDDAVRVERQSGAWTAHLRVAKGSRQFRQSHVPTDIAEALQVKARSMEKSITCPEPECKAKVGEKCKTFGTHRARVAALEEFHDYSAPPCEPHVMAKNVRSQSDSEVMIG